MSESVLQVTYRSSVLHKHQGARVIRHHQDRRLFSQSADTTRPDGAFQAVARAIGKRAI